MKTVLALSRVVIKELYSAQGFLCSFRPHGGDHPGDGVGRASFTTPRLSVTSRKFALLLIWISAVVIAISTRPRQIPAERESRTIFPLLAKPVTRTQVLLGKFSGCWLACGLALIVFYLFFGIVSGAREHHWPLLNFSRPSGCIGSCWAWLSPSCCSARWSLPRPPPMPPSPSSWCSAFCCWGAI